jgi:hypothetical protein
VNIVAVRLLDHRGMYFPRTYCLNRVEIRNGARDTPSERKKIAKSNQAFGDARPDDCMRIVTVVEAGSDGEADSIAEEHFEEALDVLAPGFFGMSRMALLPTGIYRHLPSMNVTARLPGRDHTSGTSFRIMREPFPQLDFPQFLLTETKTDLKQRLVRSYHWSRKANLEANRQLRVLFRWFAMETIWMLSKDDDIVPRIMWVLGFPVGPAARMLSQTFVSNLQAHPTISAWKNKIEQRLRAVKTFRNDSVHSGFRLQDVARSAIREFDRIGLIACSRVQGVASAGILAGVTTASELLEYLPVLIESNGNYTNDIHNNVLYTFEHPLHI